MHTRGENEDEEEVVRRKTKKNEKKKERRGGRLNLPIMSKSLKTPPFSGVVVALCANGHSPEPMSTSESIELNSGVMS